MSRSLASAGQIRDEDDVAAPSASYESRMIQLGKHVIFFSALLVAATVASFVIERSKA
jgi:hypothetical protein